MPRVIDGVTDIRPVSYVYVPGFSNIRYQDQWHPIMSRRSPEDAEVFVMRRVYGPLDPSDPSQRENAFINAKYCPSPEFAEAAKATRSSS